MECHPAMTTEADRVPVPDIDAYLQGIGTGASDKVVSEVLGHSRASTRNQYYRRVDRRHQQKMALGLAALLQPSAPEHVAGGVVGGTAEANASVKAG